MKVALILAMAAFPLLQDEAGIRDLVRQLDSEAPEDREQAFRVLAKMGTTALPQLRQELASTGSEEVRARLKEVIASIEEAEQIRNACPDPKLITLIRQGNLRDALDGIAAQTGVTIDPGDADLDGPAPIRLEQVSLFEALDQICGRRENCTWEHPEAGLIRMIRAPHVPLPSSYAGSFRTRVVSVTSERTTDFHETRRKLTLRVQTDFERHLHPVAPPSYGSLRTVDDANRKVILESPSIEDRMPVRRRPAIRMQGPFGVEDGIATFTAECDLEAKSIQRFAGIASFRLPLPSTDIIIDSPEGGSGVVVGDFAFKVVSRDRDSFHVQIGFDVEDMIHSWGLELTRRLDAASVSVVHGSGQDMKSQGVASEGHSSHMGGTRPRVEVAYEFKFAGLKDLKVKALKFRFATRTMERKVPFELRNIPLP